MSPWWQRAVIGLALLSLAVAACAARTDQPAKLQGRARAIPLEEDAPERVRLGELRFEAGFALSAGSGFGGMSGLWIAPDGHEIVMVSDRGTLWRAALEHAGDRLTGIGDWSQLTLPRAPGDPAGRADAEALADDGQGLIVAYEGEPYLSRLMPDDPGAPAQPPVPARLAGSGNTGIEALTALQGGALLALSEGVSDGPGRLAAWRIDGDRILPLSYVTADGFVPTGADRLDEVIYVVERRLSLRDGGFATRVVALDVDQVRPEAPLVGRELARIGRPAISENFEGIAARRSADGRTLLYLIADDNFFELQRTLLLQFSLPNG